MPRILVVDDRPELRTLLRRMLQADGYEVAEASDGDQALAQVAEASFDVVITDMHMPGMDGLELTQALHAQAHPPAVIAMTGNDVALTLTMTKMSGAPVTLQKPFTIEQVRAAVGAALASGPQG